jgi:ABC-2 type transport system ATP-binding protein
VSVIVTNGLGKRYGRAIVALDDLTIDVRPGEIFGFLGPNGAGKSTTIRLLLGFLHPTVGQAIVLGLDTERESVQIRSRVGYLPGGIALYDSLNGEDLLDYLAALYGRPAPNRSDLLDRFEFSERDLRRPVRDYSRGMRQKIGIVQALQHDPELAILDEPTEGLDPLMQRAFYGILEDLRARGRTIFISSHVLSEVERVCDRVAIIRQGRLATLQDVGALLARRKRHVEMRLAGPPPALDGVPGVSGVALSDGLLTCQLEGDVRQFLRAIANAPITDLTIEPAHLEEAFLEFYADELGLIAGRDRASRAAPAATVSDVAASSSGDVAPEPVGVSPGRAADRAVDRETDRETDR